MINVKIAACLVSTHKAVYGCISKKKKKEKVSENDLTKLHPWWKDFMMLGF